MRKLWGRWLHPAERSRRGHAVERRSHVPQHLGVRLARPTRPGRIFPPRRQRAPSRVQTEGLAAPHHPHQLHIARARASVQPDRHQEDQPSSSPPRRYSGQTIQSSMRLPRCPGGRAVPSRGSGCVACADPRDRRANPRIRRTLMITSMTSRSASLPNRASHPLPGTNGPPACGCRLRTHQYYYA